MPTQDRPDLIVSKTRDYNNDTGASWVYTYEGTEAELGDVRAHWELAGTGAPIGYGYKTSLSQRAGFRQLTVRVPDSILFTERWDLDTEMAMVPWIWIDQVRNSVPTWAALDITDALALTQLMRRVGFVQAAADAIRTGRDPLSVLPTTGDAFFTADFSAEEVAIMFLLIRDGDNVEWARPVLKRIRVVPVGSSSRTQLVGLPPVYETDVLINVFTTMPDDVVDQIVTIDSGLPAPVPNTVWGWRMRQDNSQTLVGSGKVEEVRDWVFGRWSLLTHELATS
jgi:hypothetical protein